MCVAAAIGGAAVIGAGASIYGANKSAHAQKDAANQANSTQMAMYNQTRSDLGGYRGVGNDAASALANFYGLGGQKVDYNKLLSSLPGYQFQLQTGTKAVDQNLAARGLLQSGAAGKALEQYGQGLGQQYANQYTSGLAGLANLGENAAAGTGAAGQAAANNISAGQMYAGNAAGAGYINSANAINSGLQGVAGAYGMYQGGQQYGGTGAPWMGSAPRTVDMTSDNVTWTGLT
jgi:hypothetical protein